MRGRHAIHEYWCEVPKSQKDISFESRVLASFPEHGIAWWRAAFTRVPGGNHVTLDGIFVVHLNAHGKCWKFEEWWHRKEEHPGSAH